MLRSPWTQLLLALLALALLQGFVVKLYAVPSGSMEPTLHGGAGLNGDRILANRLAYAGAGPGRGDIVLFTAPHGWSPPVERSWLRTAAGWVGDATGIGPSNMNTLVKRVIAVGGDTLSCCSADGRVLLNGSPIHERYVVSDLPFEPGVLDCASTPASLRCLPEIAVPERSLLVMGDNRPS
ncbi:MAG: signal peptidase I [Microbacterium sp.]|nr:signal peptidase I [Microbacterium sp.]